MRFIGAVADAAASVDLCVIILDENAFHDVICLFSIFSVLVVLLELDVEEGGRHAEVNLIEHIWLGGDAHDGFGGQEAPRGEVGVVLGRVLVREFEAELKEFVGNDVDLMGA